MNKKRFSTLVHIALVVATLATFIVPASPVAAAWLGTWENRATITIADADVDADLTNFPIILQLDATSGKTNVNAAPIFTELASNANRKKIAVTESDGLTQLYVEIEYFNVAENKAVLHVGSGNGTWTLSNNGTTLYLYYDSAQPDNTAWVADIGGRTELYSSAYKYVNHMADYNVDAYKSQSFQSTAAEGYFVMEPDVTYVANATHPFQMWLHTNGPTASAYRIYYYESDNGLGNWTQVGLASPNSGYAAPSVLNDPAGDGKYWMYAEPTPSWPPQSFNLLKSNNQTGFTVNTSNILAVSGNGSAFDSAGIANPHVWVEDATHWYMMYVGFNSGVWRVGLATSMDGYNWTKSSNQTGTGGSILFPGERHSDSGTTYKVGNTYYHAGHGNWINTPDGPTDIQQWYSSTDLVNWSPISGTGYQSFITRSQSWEGNANNEGQTADLCGLANNDGSPMSINGSAYFYYTAVIIQTPDAGSPISIGLIKLPTTFQEYVVNGVNSLKDSTANHNDPAYLDTPLPGTGVGNAKTFRQGETTGQSWFGTNSSSSLNSLTTDFTFVASVNDTYTVKPGMILSKDFVGNTRQFNFQTDLAEDGSRHPGLYFWDNSSVLNYFGGTAVNLTGTLHRVVCTKNSTNGRHVYVDGVELSLSYNVGSGGSMNQTTQPLYVGHKAGTTWAEGVGIVGTIDEVAISSDVWSLAWVKADNKNVTDTLVTYQITSTPTINTLGATVAATSANVSGNVTNMGSATTANVSFEYGLTTAYGNTTANQTANATGTFTANISGLAANTLYHFRFVVVSDAGSVNGSDGNFTTSNYTLPTINTLGAIPSKTTANISGNITALGDMTTANVSFEYGLTAGYGSTTLNQTANATGTFTANLSSLTANTLYHFRFVVYSNVGTVNGSDGNFTTTNFTLPTANTLSAITAATSANVSGNITNMGDAATANVSFEYGLTAAYGNTTPNQTTSSTGTFTANISGLAAATLYHYRFVVYSDVGNVTGADGNFTTGVTPPTVNTLTGAIVARTSANVSGNITNFGTATTANVSFVYGLTSSYGSTTANQTASGTGTFTANITGLTPSTLYHYKFVVVSDAGSVNGTDRTFTTSANVLPTINTGNATAVKTSANLTGNLTAMGDATTANVSFQYGLTASYGTNTSAQNTVATGNFSVNITGLTANTTYHYRMVVVSDVGSVNGTDRTFTTQAATLQTVTTKTAVADNTTANMTANLTSLGDATTANVSFQYGKTLLYGSTSPAVAQNATGVFSANVGSLTSGTFYHFRAKTVTQYGTVYGADGNFTTTGTAPAPTVSTAGANLLRAVLQLIVAGGLIIVFLMMSSGEGGTNGRTVAFLFTGLVIFVILSAVINALL